MIPDCHNDYSVIDLAIGTKLQLLQGKFSANYRVQNVQALQVT